MSYLTVLGFLVAYLAAVGSCVEVDGPATTYKLCQSKTCQPTLGCPPGTLYVSQHDKRANFTSIQAAIASLDATPNAPAYILIGAGNYTEQLNVTRPGPLTLLGQSSRPRKGQLYANISVGDAAANEVQIWWNSANFNVRFPDNVYTGVLTVGPTLNATLTGSGPTGFPVPADTPFGSSDFRAYNIDFRNEEVPYSHGPAHAVGVSRTNAGFYSCGLYSWQDTLYVGKLGNAYFYDTIIAGQTDFLYGFGTAYITQSTLSLRSCGGGITAWKGTNTTFTNKYGVYIDHSRVQAANATIAAQEVGRCSLGRPWNAMHRSIYMDTSLDAMTLPGGYTAWGTTDPRVDNTTFMATWEARGPGYNETAERASNVTKVLSGEEVAPFRWPVDVFQTADGAPGYVGWIDANVLVD